jgi:hypothetical protein
MQAVAIYDYARRRTEPELTFSPPRNDIRTPISGGSLLQVWSMNRRRAAINDRFEVELALELPNDNDNSLFDEICEDFRRPIWCTRHGTARAAHLS